jgi:hypothetical protein
MGTPAALLARHRFRHVDRSIILFFSVANLGHDYYTATIVVESPATLPSAQCSPAAFCRGMGPNGVREAQALTREPIKPMALHSFHPVRCAKDDLLQGRVNRIYHRAFGMSGNAGCIHDLGKLEISRNVLFQPDGSGESLGAFHVLLGFHYCAVHCGLRDVRISPEEMNPSPSVA